MKVGELVSNCHNRHLDMFNGYMLGFRDRCLMSSVECWEILTVLNERLPGECNRSVHWLRRALCEAMDVIRCEDVIAKFSQEPPKHQIREGQADENSQ